MKMWEPSLFREAAKQRTEKKEEKWDSETTYMGRPTKKKQRASRTTTRNKREIAAAYGIRMW